MGVSMPRCHPRFQISSPHKEWRVAGLFSWVAPLDEPGMAGGILNSALNPLKLRYLWVIQRDRARKQTDIQWPEHQSRVLHQRCQFTSSMTSSSLHYQQVGVKGSPVGGWDGKECNEMAQDQPWSTPTVSDLEDKDKLTKETKVKKEGRTRVQDGERRLRPLGRDPANQFHKLLHLRWRWMIPTS